MSGPVMLAIAIISLAIAPFLIAPTYDLAGEPRRADQKIYRVGLLPLCNPGLSCDPQLPSRVERDFFRHSSGVATFIAAASAGRALLQGTSTSWLRPRHKLRNAEDAMNQRDELINLAKEQLDLSQFDIFILYGEVGSKQAEHNWSFGDGFKVHRNAIDSGVILLLNSDVTTAPKKKQNAHAMLPALSWAREILDVLGLDGQADRLICPDTKQIASCHIRRKRDPFSIMGEHSLALMPNWSMKQGLQWVDDKDLMVVNQPGTYRLDYQDPYMPRALEIRLDKPLSLNPDLAFDRIIIEHRPKAGQKFFRFKTWHDPSLGAPYQGVNIYLGQMKTTSTVSTALLDLTANKGQDDLTPPSPLHIGRELQVFETNLSLKLVDTSDTSVTISVQGIGDEKTLTAQTEMKDPGI